VKTSRLIAIVAVTACHHAAEHKSATQSASQVAVVTRGALTDRVLLTGELHAASAVELVVPRTMVTWELAIRWMAEDGAFVKQGDRVLSFDNSSVTADIETKRLALLEAQMTLQTARDTSAMDTAQKQNELDQHKVALQKAKVLAGVPADLLAKRDAQERQLDQKRAEIAVKKAQEDVDAQVKEADLDLRVKQIDMEKAKRAIDDADNVIDALELKAPRDGIVVIGIHPWEDRKYRLADTVQPGWSIVTMPDVAAGMEVHAELSDVDDGRVNVGMIGTCTLDAYPSEPTPCTVKQLTPVARSKNEQSLRRAFAVELELAKPDARLRPGMSVKVELSRPGIQNVVLVPRGAVAFPDSEKDQVRVHLADGGLRDVELGACNAQNCIVDKGLAEGDRVLVGGGG
jgi:HlyD family secretion protein